MFKSAETQCGGAANEEEEKGWLQFAQELGLESGFLYRRRSATIVLFGDFTSFKIVVQV